MAIDLHHLALFQEAAQAGGITAAAEKLLISQPAVSRQIKQLETALGATLLERHAKGTRLTPAGEILAGYAARIFALAEEAETAMDDLSKLRRGRLRVGASPTLGTYVLPRAIIHFRRRFPGIVIRHEIASAAILAQRMEDGLLDLAVTEALVTAPSLETRTIGQEELCAIVHPGHAFVGRKSVRRDQFCREPLITRETDSTTRSFVERALSTLGLSPTPALTLPSTEAIKQAVAAGLGVAIVPAVAVELELAAMMLWKISLAGLNLRRPIYALLPRTTEPSKPARAFVCLVQHAVRGTLPGIARRF